MNTKKNKIKKYTRNREKTDGGARKQVKTIQSLMKRNDVELIISACDYDREGQIIGDSIINNLQPNKPVYRLLINEWTKQEVLRGIEEMKPNEEMQSLQDAGVSRQWRSEERRVGI